MVEPLLLSNAYGNNNMFFILILKICEIPLHLFTLSWTCSYTFDFVFLLWLTYLHLFFSFLSNLIFILNPSAVPIQCCAGVGTINHIANRHAPTDNRAINRGGEGETFSMQQKLHISLNNNFCQDEPGRIGTVLNPNHVSTGLKLSCEEEERNSSVTSACENMKNNVPVMLSLGNTVKMEIDQQTEEFGRYIKLQVFESV